MKRIEEGTIVWFTGDNDKLAKNNSYIKEDKLIELTPYKVIRVANTWDGKEVSKIALGGKRWWHLVQNFTTTKPKGAQSYKAPPLPDNLFPGFRPGDKVILLPDSYNPLIELADFAFEEDLKVGKAYEVERAATGYWKQIDPGTDKRKNRIIEWIELVHTQVCGGSGGYSIPAYRFKLAPKKTKK